MLNYSARRPRARLDLDQRSASTVASNRLQPVKLSNSRGPAPSWLALPCRAASRGPRSMRYGRRDHCGTISAAKILMGLSIHREGEFQLRRIISARTPTRGLADRKKAHRTAENCGPPFPVTRSAFPAQPTRPPAAFPSATGLSRPSGRALRLHSPPGALRGIA